MDSSTITVILFIINFLLVVIMTLIGFIVKGMQGRISEIEKEMREMKGNYIDRFAAVVQAINESNTNGEARHTELKELILSGRTQCALHELKISNLEVSQSKRRKAAK